MSKYLWGLMVCLSALILSACTLGADADVSPSNRDRNEKQQIDDGDGYELRPEVENVNDHLDYTNSDFKTIYFSGGCFWGVEAYMQRIYGVSETSAGYANGTGENPSYEDVIRGKDGFVEAVEVTYDPERVSLETLIDRLFLVIDPTSENRQGNDVGIQYRTGIYFTDEQDAEIIATAVEDEQTYYDKKIVTETEPLDAFYLAEDMHQDYLAENPNGYCHINLNIVDEFTIDPIPEDESRIRSLSVDD